MKKGPEFYLLVMIIMITSPVLFVIGLNSDCENQIKYNIEANCSRFEEIPSSSSGRTINFSGYGWIVRDTALQTQGPGPNYFNDTSENVFLDDNGYLHLKIRKYGDNWYCSEIYTTESFGYGTYIFKVSPSFQDIDINAVLGLFTYYNDTQEIDIEFAKWGYENNNNSQFVCQPSIEGNIDRFSINNLETSSIHAFTWCSDYIYYTSTTHSNISAYYNALNESKLSLLDDNILNDWLYEGNYIPIPRTERVHINFWLMNGLPPNDSQDSEVVIEEFQFLPWDCSKEIKIAETSPSEISSYNVGVIYIICMIALIIITRNSANFSKELTIHTSLLFF